MPPTDVLVREHRVILQVLACLEKMMERYRNEGKVPVEDVRAATDFFRNYADRCHHGKEESHLFPAMELKGFSPQFGPTGVMRHEHELGRGYIKAMAAALEQYEAGDESAANRLYANAAAYISLLRQHIEKEDHCLFPMANQALGGEDQAKLAEIFKQVDEEEIGLEAIGGYCELAERLAARYGIEAAEQQPAQPAGQGPCGM